LLKYIENKEKILEFYESDRCELLMHHDFSKARSIGANSFPLVVKIDKERDIVCLKGYRTLSEIL